MKRTTTFRLPVLLFPLLVSFACTESGDKAPAETSPETIEYLGMAKPGPEPVLFAPGIISTQRNERDMAIAPDGTELLYSYALPGFSRSTLLTTRFDGRQWTDPETAPFSGSYNDLEPAFSPDGSGLFFISRRPLHAADSADDWNIWQVARQDGKWMTPEPLGAPVNGEGNEFYPSIASSGNLYFTAEDLPGSLGGEDIWMAPRVGDGYGPAVNLGAGVNSPGPEFNAWVSPDESCLVFSSWGRDDGHGGGDLYISFRDLQGTWGKARNMGSAVNSDKLDYCPFVSHDGRFLFFTSQRLDPRVTDREPKSVQAIRSLEDGPGNGLGDIYWMAFDPSRWK